jgi:hypothetical protein
MLYWKSCLVINETAFYLLTGKLLAPANCKPRVGESFLARAFLAYIQIPHYRIINLFPKALSLKLFYLPLQLD